MNKTVEGKMIFSYPYLLTYVLGVKQMNGYTKTSGSSAATNFGVMLHLFFKVMHERNANANEAQAPPPPPTMCLVVERREGPKQVTL